MSARLPAPAQAPSPERARAGSDRADSGVDTAAREQTIPPVLDGKPEHALVNCLSAVVCVLERRTATDGRATVVPPRRYSVWQKFLFPRCSTWGTVSACGKEVLAHQLCASEWECGAVR